MRLLVAVLALATAMPVVSVPVSADAQVLTGRSSAPRRPRTQPPRLTQAEQMALFDAQDVVDDMNSVIDELTEAGEAAGGLSDQQRAELDAATARRDEAQATVARLEAKRDR